jgi:hypothetical protein
MIKPPSREASSFRPGAIAAFVAAFACCLTMTEYALHHKQEPTNRREGLKRPPPSRGTATFAGSEKTKAGNAIRLEESTPAAREPFAPFLA